MIRSSFSAGMKTLVQSAVSASLALGLLGATTLVHAQDSTAVSEEQAKTIRTTLEQRIPQLKGIEEIRTTPMEGLFELRLGTNLFYTTATGDFLISGELFDTKATRNLTEARINELTAINYSSLPFDDAFTIVRGDGSRKLAIFEDPNCGYCKRFEKNMLDVDNVTIHVFLYPILGQDSVDKSRNIWCAKQPEETWNAWMLENKAPQAQASCDNLEAIQRNVAFGRQYKITGTPTIVFEDNTRIPGAIEAPQVEQKLQAITASR